MTRILSVRLDETRFKSIDILAKENKIPKSQALKEIFDQGRIDVAVRLYKEGKISIEKASKIAGLSISEMFDELRKEGIELNISLDDFKESLKHLRNLVK